MLRQVNALPGKLGFNPLPFSCQQHMNTTSHRLLLPQTSIRPDRPDSHWQNAAPFAAAVLFEESCLLWRTPRRTVAHDAGQNWTVPFRMFRQTLGEKGVSFSYLLVEQRWSAGVGTRSRDLSGRRRCIGVWDLSFPSRRCAGFTVSTK